MTTLTTIKPAAANTATESLAQDLPAGLEALEQTCRDALAA